MALTVRGGVSTVARTPDAHRARVLHDGVSTGHRDLDVSGKAFIPRICDSMRLGLHEPRPER